MQLFYRQLGSGRPVIILHGLFGQSDNWITIAKKISTHFEVFIPDLRNHGQSPHSPTLTYPQMADDLLEFIEVHQVKEPIILGHSMGGKVAMTFALEHPELLEKLIIVDISPRKYAERDIHAQVLMHMMALDLSACKTRMEVERILETKIKDLRIRMFILKNLYYKMPGILGWRLNLQAISDSLDNLFDWETPPGIFRKPVLFIRGGKSDYILDEDTPGIKSLFPSFRIVTIPEASHWVHSDAPQSLCKVLSEFMGKECII